MISGLAPARLLAVWEAGLSRHPVDRALLLAAVAAPEVPAERLADQPLGWLNQRLVAWRAQLFGARLEALVDCPACGERMEFELGPETFPPVPERFEAVEVAGRRFALPTPRHLAGATGAGGADTTAQLLLRACAEAPEALPEDRAELLTLLAEVGERMDEADPWADLALALVCPACGEAFGAHLDPAEILWEELAVQAGALLDDVHALARAYGWREPEILALSAARRAAYLARIGT